MPEDRIYESTPHLKESPDFPLHALYKEPTTVVRVEPDGSIFSHRSSHELHVYLTLRYDRLYLNWCFYEEDDHLRLFEYNTEFPYTGTIVFSDFGARSFENGHLTEKDTPEVRDTLIPSPETLALISDKDMEFLIRKFYSHLNAIEKRRQSYAENLSAFLHTKIPQKNQGVLSDEIDIEQLHRHVYFDTIYVEDEYETVLAILIGMAKEIYENTVSKEYASHFDAFFTSKKRRALQRRLRNAFSRRTLRSMIQSHADPITEEDASSMTEEQKIEFLSLLHLIPLYPDRPQTPATPRRRLRSTDE